MQLDTVIPALKLLTALFLLCVNYLVLLPYLVKPEKFYIRPLRQARNHKVTHAQLIVRAFGGVGIVSAGLHSLAFCLALSLVLDFVWIWVWLALTFGGGLVLGTGFYIRFRLQR